MLIMETTPPSRRELFDEYFEEHTGWDPSEYPNQTYVEDMRDFFEKGWEEAQRRFE